MVILGTIGVEGRLMFEEAVMNFLRRAMILYSRDRKSGPVRPAVFLLAALFMSGISGFDGSQIRFYCRAFARFFRR